MKKELSVVIPCYNEENTIGKTITAIEMYLTRRRYDYEIIMIDDGSTDKTGETIAEYASKKEHVILLKNSRNLGKGNSVKQGVMCASKKYVLMCDADGTVPISELEKLEPLITSCPVVIASRRKKEATVSGQPQHRKIPGFVFSALVKMIVLRGIDDTQCGFKLFMVDDAKKIFGLSMISGFAFDAEILYIAKKKGIAVREVPITAVFNTTRTSIRLWRDPVVMLKDLIRIRLNDWRGKYGEKPKRGN